MYRHRILPSLTAALLLSIALSATVEGKPGGGKPPKATPTPEPPITNPAFVYLADDDTRPSPYRQLFLTTADGSATQQLTFDAYKHHIPEWSPDGTRIAYARPQEGEVVPWCGGIYARNSDGTGQEDLLLDLCDEESPVYLWPTASRLSWSPDDQILFGAQGWVSLDPGIYVLDLDSGEVSNIVPSLTTGVLDRAIDATWSPDMDDSTAGYQGEIAACGYTCPETGPCDPTGILILDPATGDVQREIPGTAAYGCDEGRTEIDWSADGDWLVYSMAADESPFQLMKSRADGTGQPIILGEVFQAEARWSPDSDYISYIARLPYHNSLQRDVVYVNADGSGLVNVTQTNKQDEFQADWNPVWDPDD